MTRIDFYRISSGDLLQAACLVTGKAYQAGYRVRLYAADEDRLAELDRRLWTFRQNAFVPHARSDRVDPDHPEPVLLAADCRDPQGAEVLICASPPPVDCLGAYARAAEFVPAEPDARNEARTRYATYREAGFDLHVHDIQAN